MAENILKQALEQDMASKLNLNTQPNAPAEQRHPVRGTGGGKADAVEAELDSGEPARIAEGEFVFPADVVSDLGDGSSEAGARVLQEIIDEVRVKRQQGEV